MYVYTLWREKYKTQKYKRRKVLRQVLTSWRGHAHIFRSLSSSYATSVLHRLTSIIKKYQNVADVNWMKSADLSKAQDMWLRMTTSSNIPEVDGVRLEDMLEIITRRYVQTYVCIRLCMHSRLIAEYSDTEEKFIHMYVQQRLQKYLQQCERRRSLDYSVALLTSLKHKTHTYT